ncbi:MAG: hypothetical protein C0459_08455 [Chitinophaga sp.]|jgi:PKD repeat protein|nr:hypothetical protein [Chitinophaga sp.]
MRKIFTFFLFVLLSIASLANTVIIKGFVKNTAGVGIFKKAVKISTDSVGNAATCSVTHIKYTDSTGRYIDTITCNGDIKKLRIIVENCDGSKLINTPDFTTTIAESNFTVCIPVVTPPPPAKCSAIFSFEKISSKQIRFNSSKSVTSGDSIVSRFWRFGDSTTLSGNEISPLKTYASKGNYNVCLTIQSKSGCTNTYCSSVIITDSIPSPPPPPAKCSAMFSFEKISSKQIRFNSSKSVTSGDSIVSRFWRFGDSATLTSNEISPLKTYASKGNYNVCLTIQSKSGCTNTYCSSVEITDSIPPPPPPVTCTANFSIEKLGPKKLRFNSSKSIVAAGDSIVSRFWRFGDSTTLTGNEISPAKEYTTNGVYTVFLNTVSAKGCKSEFCEKFTLVDSAAGTTPVNNAAIKIISINPNPVTTRMLLTIWCANNNTDVELGITDIYGFKRWSMKKTLTQGNNTIEIAVSFLTGGAYFLKVGSKYGSLSRGFYKL